MEAGLQVWLQVVSGSMRIDCTTVDVCDAAANAAFRPGQFPLDAMPLGGSFGELMLLESSRNSEDMTRTIKPPIFALRDTTC